MSSVNTIWKFPLEITDRQTIQVPAGAKLLTVQTQNGRPCLWAEVDPSQRMEARQINTFGTGRAGVHGVYIGTIQVLAIGEVLHVYESDQ